MSVSISIPDGCHEKSQNFLETIKEKINFQCIINYINGLKDKYINSLYSEDNHEYDERDYTFFEEKINIIFLRKYEFQEN